MPRSRSCSRQSRRGAGGAAGGTALRPLLRGLRLLLCLLQLLLRGMQRLAALLRPAAPAAAPAARHAAPRRAAARPALHACFCALCTSAGACSPGHARCLDAPDAVPPAEARGGREQARCGWSRRRSRGTRARALCTRATTTPACWACAKRRWPRARPSPRSTHAPTLQARASVSPPPRPAGGPDA